MSNANTIEDTQTLEQLCEKAESDMIKALNTYGSREVLDLLVALPREDLVVQWLLGRYPAVVAMSEFFYQKPLIVSREESENFLNTDSLVLIREENEREEDRKAPPPIKKRKKTSKRKKKPEWLNQYLR